jgi:hypothetical protein
MKQSGREEQLPDSEHEARSQALTVFSMWQLMVGLVVASTYLARQLISPSFVSSSLHTTREDVFKRMKRTHL